MTEPSFCLLVTGSVLFGLRGCRFAFGAGASPSTGVARLRPIVVALSHGSYSRRFNSASADRRPAPPPNR